MTLGSVESNPVISLRKHTQCRDSENNSKSVSEHYLNLPCRIFSETICLCCLGHLSNPPLSTHADVPPVQPGLSLQLKC